MAFEFEAVNDSYYEEEFANQQKASFTGSQVPILFLKDGITVVRIMPPFKGSGGMWMRKIYEHTIKVGDKFSTATCPRMVQKDCPICEVGERLFDEGKTEGNTEKLEQAKKMGYSTKYLANVICYSSPDPENGSLQKGIMVMKFGTKVKSALLEFNQAVDTGWANITDIANGVDFRITRSGRGLNTQYTVMPMGARSNLQAKLAASGIDLGALEQHDLNTVLTPRSYEDLAAIMAGQARTPGFLPKPATQATPVAVAGPVVVTQPVVVQVTPPIQGTSAVPMQPNPVVQMTQPIQQVVPTTTGPGPVPLSAFSIQPLPQQSTTQIPVQVPQMVDSPPPIGAPVREVK